MQEAEHCGGEPSFHWNSVFAETHLSRCRQLTSIPTADKLKSLVAIKQLMLHGLSKSHARHIVIVDMTLGYGIETENCIFLVIVLVLVLKCRYRYQTFALLLCYILVFHHCKVIHI